MEAIPRRQKPLIFKRSLSGSTDSFKWKAGIIPLSSMKDGKHGTDIINASNPVSNLKHI